eukprot:TRINITY_DN1604_c0_g1_i2.p1 TRINITY_DN1604_c0_g1~~TRINITY_DN1604_c0_g1_i2.p1  ORF type:complete len:188 (-),score=25.78 TRINITY_DN1604_c0_g1_i2:230-793(-)
MHRSPRSSGLSERGRTSEDLRMWGATDQISHPSPPPVGTWSVQNAVEALHFDSELILLGHNSLTKAVDDLQSGRITWEHEEAYVHSESKRAWFCLRRHEGAWSMEHVRPATVIDHKEWIIEGCGGVTEAVERLNGGEFEDGRPVSFVFSNSKQKWFMLIKQQEHREEAGKGGAKGKGGEDKGKGGRW